jgi:hypothetical protein
MQSFSFNDAIRFKLATQQEDTGAKIQVFLGVLLGVLLRWFYGIVVDVVKGGPWDFRQLGGHHRPHCHRADLHGLCLFRLLGQGEGSAGRHAVPELAGVRLFHRRAGRTLDVLGG